MQALDSKLHSHAVSGERTKERTPAPTGDNDDLFQLGDAQQSTPMVSKRSQSRCSLRSGRMIVQDEIIARYLSTRKRMTF